MSVKRTICIIYGADIGYSNELYENYELEIEGSPDRDFDILYDGMSGEYAIAGCILHKIDVSEWNNDEILRKVDVKPKHMDEYVSKARLEFPELADFDYILVDHYT